MKHDILINRYLDGEASRGEKDQVLQLLETDKDFEKEFNKLSAMFKIMNNTTDVETPDFVAERILNNVKYSSPHPRTIFSKLIVPALAVSFSFAIGIFSTSFLFNDTQQSVDSVYSQTTVVAELNLDDYIDNYYGN